MTDEEIKKLINETARATSVAVAGKVARAATRDTLKLVGIDPDNPLEAQETAAALRKLAKEENVRAIYFARRAQRTCESTRNRVVAGAGAVVYAWLAGVFDPVIKKFGGG